MFHRFLNGLGPWTVRWVGVLAIGWLWFTGGPRVAWQLYEWMSWHPFPQDRVEEIAFAPVETHTGGLELILFRDLERRRGEVRSFQPPARVLEDASLLDVKFQAMEGSRVVPDWVATVRIRVLDRDEGRYEITLKYPDATGCRWRYLASQDRIVPIEWFMMRDTAGFLLLPLTIMAWLVGIPIGLWLSRSWSRWVKRQYATA